MIKLVAFDGDDTLWDWNEAMRPALRSTLEELWTLHPGPATGALTVERMIRIRDRVAAELEGRVVDLAVVRHAAFERTLEEVGIDDSALAARLNAMFFAVKDLHSTPYPDAVPVLTEISRRYQSALLTNGNADPARYGLDRFLYPTVRASDEGVAKPEPGIFEILLERTGFTPGEAVYVGDSAEDDVVGARAAGLRSIWVNRKASENTTGVLPDAEVESLAEVPGVLEDWA